MFGFCPAAARFVLQADHPKKQHKFQALVHRKAILFVCVSIATRCTNNWTGGHWWNATCGWPRLTVAGHSGWRPAIFSGSQLLFVVQYSSQTSEHISDSVRPTASGCGQPWLRPPALQGWIFDWSLPAAADHLACILINI
eukprot:EG_transcript_23857